MELQNIQKEGKKYKEEVYALYVEAFPEVERKPLELIETLSAQGKMEMLAITENEEFLGLAINMMTGKTALLDYFAIAPGRRGGGIGSRSLKLLLERFHNQKYIFEIEKQDEQAENAAERKRRKELGLSQEELAKKCGVSRQTVNAIENNKYDPTLSLAFSLAKELQLTVDELFTPS